jgi:hypothetical protein
MQDTGNDVDHALDDAQDTTTIVCDWPHALFLWTHLLTPRKLFYDRTFGDLAVLRDALVAARDTSLGTPDSPVDKRAAVAPVATVASVDDTRAPLTLVLPRAVATRVAWHLVWSRALPDLLPDMVYDAESASLFPSHLVARAQELGDEWERQLYLDPAPPSPSFNKPGSDQRDPQ